jgi:hypothetical protein
LRKKPKQLLSPYKIERKIRMKRMKRKTVWAYLDGKKLVDVVKAALDNNMMVDDMKALLIKENPGHEVTFKCE